MNLKKVNLGILEMKSIKEKVLEKLTDRLKILKHAKKRKRVIIREADYWICEAMVSEGLLNKNISENGRSHGWPEYRISKRGLRYIKKCQSH